MLVGVWVACGVLGMLVLLVPALRLWRVVRDLGREVGRVSDSLLEASTALEVVSRELPTRHDAPPVDGRHR